MRYLWDFAVSYASEDEGVAKAIADRLMQSGYPTFIAVYQRARLVGEDAHRVYEVHLGKKSRFFLAIISESYVRKDHPQLEWSIALEENNRRRYNYIIPIRLDDTKLLGLAMSVLYLDYKKLGFDETIRQICEKYHTRFRKRAKVEPIVKLVATFGVNMYESFEEEPLPSEAPAYYPLLCDWLQNDLLQRLNKTDLVNIQPMDDLRTGETYSVRVAFDFDTGHVLDFGFLAWWDILEVEPFTTIYPTKSE